MSYSLNSIKQIDGFSDYYVSINGDVFSKKKKEFRKLKATPHTGGYMKLKLINDNGKRCDCYVHRLVATAFLEKKSKDVEVNHKNGDKTDNRVENLEWITRRDNIIHMFEKLKKGTLSYFDLYYKDFFIGKFKGIKTCAWFAGVNPESLHVHHKVGNWHIKRTEKVG